MFVVVIQNYLENGKNCSCIGECLWCIKVDPDDIRIPNVEEPEQTSRLYTLHRGIGLNEEQVDNSAAAAAAGGASQEMTYTDRQNHHLWLKSKASR